jgi:hypothetical protein
MVEPSTLFRKDGEVIKFALYAFVEFSNLNELFRYIDTQAGRWHFSTAQEREAFAGGLLRRGIESRLISMQYDKPLEILVTHTSEELSNAIGKVRTPAARRCAPWDHSLHCCGREESVGGSRGRLPPHLLLFRDPRRAAAR